MANTYRKLELDYCVNILFRNFILKKQNPKRTGCDPLRFVANANGPER